MRIGFDVSPLHRPFPPGVTRAARGLVSTLEARGRIEVVRLVPPANVDLRPWRRKALPRAVSEQSLDGLHSFTSAFARRGRGKRVQTVHELPWRHGVDENAGLSHRFWATLGGLSADATICPSEFVARDLRRGRLPGAGAVHVIPWGVGAPFADEPEPGCVDELVLGRYRLPEDPLILCLGSVRPKKNLDALLRGLAALHARGSQRPHIVVTGRETPALRRSLGLASELGLARFVSTIEEVDENDLAPLIRLASAVAVLSHSEGFGFPALEALACGTPAVVARGTAQAEIAGERGIAVDPEDPESVAAGLAHALEEREELRYVLSERAQELSWDACAAKVETLWSGLL